MGLGIQHLTLEMSQKTKMLHLVVCLAVLSVVSLAQVSISSLTAPNTSANPNYGANGNVSKLPISSLLYPGATANIYVRFMPWFGEKNHTLAGYHSNDPQQIRAQIDDMMSRGISGAFIAWYGQNDQFKDNVTTRFMQEAERRGGVFQFALSYSGTLDACAKGPGCDVTEAIVSEINYASQRYMQSPNYVRVTGRPVFFIFDLTKYSIDWSRVRREIQGQPLLLFRNSGGFNHAQSDGAYAWLAPEGSKGGDPASLEYLDRFYRAAQQNRDMVVIGSAYKGFDDSRASWGKNRHIPEQCGLTWLSSFAKANQYFSSRSQLPLVLLVTWNDYEEGTEIETGIDNCVSISAQSSESRISWQINGDERTIDHYAVLASSDGKTAIPLQDVVAGRGHSLDVANILPSPGHWTIYVEAVGRPSLWNHLSNPVQVNSAQ
jgi:Glycosyl hydrolase family 99